MGAAKKTIPPLIYVRDFMVQPVWTVSPKMHLWEVADLLIRKEISGAPIVDSMSRVISIIGEGITLRLAASEGLEATIEHCMNQLPKLDQIITVKPEDTFTDAYRLFLKHNIHRIPVIDSNANLKGIISRSVIFKIFVEAHYGRAITKKR
jgi:predicted transcriptional regulator